MPYVELIAILAVFQYLAFIVLTGQARRTSGLKAPSMTGHDGFERMYRVQMNTLETLVVFLPSLFLRSSILVCRARGSGWAAFISWVGSFIGEPMSATLLRVAWGTCYPWGRRSCLACWR